jgi:hypothetical protein
MRLRPSPRDPPMAGRAFSWCWRVLSNSAQFLRVRGLFIVYDDEVNINPPTPLFF